MNKKKNKGIYIENIILRNWNTNIILLKRRYDSKTKNLTIDASIIKESRLKKNKRITKELNKFIRRNNEEA